MLAALYSWSCCLPPSPPVLGEPTRSKTKGRQSGRQRQIEKQREADIGRERGRERDKEDERTRQERDKRGRGEMAIHFRHGMATFSSCTAFFRFLSISGIFRK